MKNILLKGRALFNGEKCIKTGPAAILIAKNRIAAMGAEAMEAAGSGAVVMDLPDQTLMPGLIDCHNHLSLDPDLPDYLLCMNDSLPELTLRAAETMKRDLFSGVTTARCLGDKGFLDVHCKNAQIGGRLPGPRLLVATRGIRASHGHGFVGCPFDGPENVRLAVRENLSAGADLIKIYLTGTLKGPKGLPCTFSEAEVKILVDEAHRAGVPVATHCIGGPGLDLALKLGIDVIEHGYFMTDEQIGAMEKSTARLVLTPGIFFTDARLDTLHGGLKQAHLEQRDQVASVMKKVVNSNIFWTIGTDAMHGGLADEVSHVVGFGADAQRALAGATIRAARLCGLESDLGSLEKGKLADIIGVEGDPVRDVSSLKKVKTVIQGGRLVKGGPK